MKKLFNDIKNLIAGMGITGKHLGRHAVTLQYPEQKMEIFERSRGVVVLLSDKETGELNCTSCMLCMKACPTAAISIDSPRGEDKKRHLKQFDVDFALCCFCGLCEEACSFDAIKLATMYEYSTLTKEEHHWDMKKLQDVGRDVPYEVTRKKKPAKPAKTKSAAAAVPNPATKSEKPAESSKPIETESQSDEGGN